MATNADTPFPTSSASPATSSAGGQSPATSQGSSASGNDAQAAGDMLNRVVQGAHSAIDRMAESAAPAVQKLQDGVSSASDAISQRAGDAREMGEEWAESLRATVRDHPLAALATALAVGVLVGRLAR
ncbi:hypothetical protein LXT12_03440 [Pelomonas sp. P7]|uniref:Membrane-anchored ribosome-binding protein, inhibits growth in stationary phase, ElaB/YqjD/DUF883 family n=1 Tax=Pelomonas caseinilytica TaxID=2906763 RepID=A0ABS8XBF8_9BURK|nr:hypothetical protein [Pelomonas sp. P7]MCE4536307.1 hypothetical protein [Pelomonas sp. P7]